MLSIWFSLTGTLAVYIGFASVLGSLVHKLRIETSRYNLIQIISFGVLIFLPASLALPLTLPLRIITWVWAIILAALFAIRPGKLPVWLWAPGFGLRYAAGTMGLILFWSLATSFISPPVIILGALAGLAGVLAWQRGVFLASQ
ncbi:MAG: hypothetical protein FVQ83_14660 [Chloroflexi bacterium]|nr:hypothetical protein [Chloroflexota bacterium]